MLRRQTDLGVRGLRRRARVAVLRPALTISSRLDDFGQTRELYRTGRDAAEAFLAGTGQFRRWQLADAGRRATARRPAAPVSSGRG